MKQLGILIVAFSFFSCTKHDTLPSVPSRYYVEYEINGTKYKQTNYTGALLWNPWTVYAYGYEVNALNANGVKLEITNGNIQPLILGTYTDTANVNGGGPNYYFGHVTLQNKGIAYGSNANFNKNSGAPFRVTLTSINADSITGVFSGRVYNGFQANFINIANGKFCSNF